MKLQCRFCSTEYDETLTNCPNCGAPNENIKKTAESGPRTLEELKHWFYDTQGLTSKKTYIYVGENCKEPAVFGMYKDENTGDFVVYKNKANGERAIRYQGVDEQYAVNELYQLIQRQALRNGIALNGAKNPGKITNRNSAINSSYSSKNKKTTTPSNITKVKGCNTGLLIIFILVYVLPLIAIKGLSLVSNFYNSISKKELKEKIQTCQTLVGDSIDKTDDPYFQELFDYLKSKGYYTQGIKTYHYSGKKHVSYLDIRQVLTNAQNNGLKLLNGANGTIITDIPIFIDTYKGYTQGYDEYRYEFTLENPDMYTLEVKPIEYHIDHTPTTTRARSYSDDSYSSRQDSDNDRDWGSSWDSNDSWDSGDWDSDWGYFLIPELQRL